MRFFTKVDQTEVQEVLSNTYIVLLYALNIKMLLPCQLNVALDHDCRTQNEKHVPCEKRITKTQEL